ncbi:MAG TPA: DUF4041 domain-containing protein [Streptosporangiaceae bacterium]|nr:DUF4041 domain-containing protein [Streptosporangiaceae bacterium]
MTVTSIPAGWYPDNQDVALVRWWDGTQWTPFPQAAQPAGPPKEDTAQFVPSHAVPARHNISGRKRDLQAEVERLQQILAGLGMAEREQLQSEVDALTSEQARAASLRAEIAQLQERREELLGQTAAMEQLASELSNLRTEQAGLKRQVVELAKPRSCRKWASTNTAIRSVTRWLSKPGAKMVREFSKLMLRAYNNEADNAVRAMKPYTLDSSIARLQKARGTITRRVTPAEVRDVLTMQHASIAEWTDEPEAVEWRQSEQTRRQRRAPELSSITNP